MWSSRKVAKGPAKGRESLGQGIGNGLKELISYIRRVFYI